MPVSMIAWRTNRAFGERNNAWRERVNKSAIAGRAASRTGIERSAAGEVVDAVFEVIAEGRPWSGATASRMKLGLDGEYRWGKYMLGAAVSASGLGSDDSEHTANLRF